MAKKEKQIDIENLEQLDDITQDLNIRDLAENPDIQVITNLDAKPLEKISGSSIHINILNIDYVDFEILTTGTKSKQSLENKSIRLLSGRVYKIPITEKNINSDFYGTIKIYSNLATKIDIKYIKDGFVYIVPIQHGFLLKNNIQICSVF